MFNKLKVGVFASLVAFSNASFPSCGQCEYKDGLTGLCLPKGGCIVQQLNPVTQVQKALTVAQAVASGDSGKIKQSLGDALISSPNCLGCQSLVHNVVPGLSDSQINSIVGEGALVFLSTGDPVLVTLDVATNVATQQNIKAPAAGVPQLPKAAPTSRSPKSYSAVAVCLIQKNGDPYIYAAWRGPASFVDSSGASHQFPDVDLISGDIVSVSAPSCPEWNDAASGQNSLTSAKFTFEAVSSLSGSAETIKWFAYGRSQ